MTRITLAVALTCATSLAIFAQVRSNAQQEQSQPTHELYRPDVGDLMAATQLRHFKLSFAGSTGNWPLASYEVGQMRKNFAQAAKLYPTLNGVPLADLIKNESEPPLNDLAKAVATKNLTDFSKAFTELTEACNHCHQAAGFGFVAIRVPTSSPFSNQTFVPASR
jgi:hypothetical protein